MKSFLSAVIVALLYVAQAQSQGIIKESLSMQSTVLGKEVQYSIYLPDGYDRTNRVYPTLYLLHGYGDDETGWTQFGEVQFIADKSMTSGEATPMIIAMPDGGVTWYLNTFDGKTKYEDFFVKEFLPFIDKNYRTRPSKQYRAIAGLSMGGYGTWELIARFPDRFAAAVPVCGGGDPATAARISHVPVWAFHGSHDTTVRPANSRKMIRALQAAGAKPGYTEYPDVGHDSWVYAYREPYLLPWMFEKRLDKNSEGN